MIYAVDIHQGSARQRLTFLPRLLLSLRLGNNVFMTPTHYCNVDMQKDI